MNRMVDDKRQELDECSIHLYSLYRHCLHCVVKDIFYMRLIQKNKKKKVPYPQYSEGGIQINI